MSARSLVDDLTIAEVFAFSCADCMALKLVFSMRKNAMSPPLASTTAIATCQLFFLANARHASTIARAASGFKAGGLMIALLGPLADSVALGELPDKQAIKHIIIVVPQARCQFMSHLHLAIRDSNFR